MGAAGRREQEGPHAAAVAAQAQPLLSGGEIPHVDGPFRRGGGQQAEVRGERPKTVAVGRAHVFESAHVWDLCAVLSTARAFVGSSLHGCVIANAFGRCAIARAYIDVIIRPAMSTLLIQQHLPAVR